MQGGFIHICAPPGPPDSPQTPGFNNRLCTQADSVPRLQQRPSPPTAQSLQCGTPSLSLPLALVTLPLARPSGGQSLSPASCVSRGRVDAGWGAMAPRRCCKITFPPARRAPASGSQLEAQACIHPSSRTKALQLGYTAGAAPLHRGGGKQRCCGADGSGRARGEARVRGAVLRASARRRHTGARAQGMQGGWCCAGPRCCRGEQCVVPRWLGAFGLIYQALGTEQESREVGQGV